MGEIFMKADSKKHETQKLVNIKKVAERLNNSTAKNILLGILGLVPMQHREHLTKVKQY